MLNACGDGVISRTRSAAAEVRGAWLPEIQIEDCVFRQQRPPREGGPQKDYIQAQGKDKGRGRNRTTNQRKRPRRKVQKGRSSEDVYDDQG